MLRRKVDQPEDQAAETGAAEAAEAAGTAPETEPVPESAVTGSESASNEPEPAQPEPGSASPEETAAAGTEPGSAPAEVEPAGVLEEDVRDEQIEVTPGPVASHSPEPQTPAEQLTARQQSVHQAP